MIDRKVLWLSIAIIVAMVGAAIWRLSLLSDWHQIPLDGPGGSHTLNSLFLFAHPLALTVATASLHAGKWFTAGSDDAVRPWRHWGTTLVFAFCILLGAMQAFVISRSLGYGVAMDRQIIARIAFAAMGVLLMVTGNARPKLPWLSMRLRALQLDPWQQNRHMRFTGKLLVGMGLFFLLVGIGLPLLRLLPQAVLLPLMLAPGPLVMAASLWHRAKVKREPSSLS